jgi:hypothetical protein
MGCFKAGQLVRVIDPRNLAYGRVAMVMGGGKPNQSKLRFVDLPKFFEPTDDPYTVVATVETFNNSQLETVEDVPIADVYLLIEIDERNEGQEYVHRCLARCAIGQTGEEIAQAIAQCWYDDDAGGRGQWDEDIEAYTFFDCALSTSVKQWREISMSEYINIRNVLDDLTPDSEQIQAPIGRP